MSLVFKNATLVDVLSKKMREKTTVTVRENHIVQVSNSDQFDSQSEVIDCDGRFLIPGMIDSHVHLDYFHSPSDQEISKDYVKGNLISRLHSYLYCGVTSIYDAGNDPEIIFPLRDLERAESLTSPRIYCTGSLITCKGGHNGFSHTTYVSSMPQDEEKIEQHISNNPDIVKVTYDEHGWGTRPLIPILPADTLQQIVSYCHSRKFLVTIHTSNELRSREAILCGIDSLAHPVIQSPVTDEFLWLLAHKKIPVVTTLTIGDRYSRLADHPEYLDRKIYRDCFSDEELTYLKNVESEKQKKNRWMMWMKVMTPVAQENLKRLIEAGGIISTGTDITSGPDYLRELELLQDAGIDPIEIVRAATFNGAVFLGKEKELGSISEGKLADLVLLDEDPLRDIRNVGSMSLVVKDGRVIDRTKLDLPVNHRKSQSRARWYESINS